jgi:DNA-binding response OmpR family regulator
LKKILIIEDDHTIGEVEKDYFELAGFEVTLMVKKDLQLHYMKPLICLF